MDSLTQTTDELPTRHASLMTAGLEMACASVSQWHVLDVTGQRQLLTAWTEFCQNLRGLGVTVPTDPTALEG